MHTASTYPTTLPKVQRGSSHFAIIDPYKYCAELDAVISVAKSKGYQLPTDYQLRCLNTYINEQISNGIWSKRDLLYLFGYGGINVFQISTNPRLLDNQVLRIQRELGALNNFVKLNFINPHKFEITCPLDSITNAYKIMLTDKGIFKVPASNTQTQYETNYVPSTDAVNYSLNNASQTTYSPSDLQVAEGNQFFINASGAINLLTLWNSINRTVYNINSTTQRSKTGVTESVGYHHFERTSSVLTTYYKNGVSIDTTAAVSTSVPSVQITLLQRANIAMSFYALGLSLGATLQKIDYELFTQLRTKLGY
jgi:hypothetical protein